MNEYQELKEFLDRNAEHLKGYTIQEKADLARAAGMSPIAVATWQTTARFKEAI